MSKVDATWGYVERAFVSLDSALAINVPKLERGAGIDQARKLREKLESALRYVTLAKSKLAEMSVDEAHQETVNSNDTQGTGCPETQED